VSGSAGFVGGYLVPELLARGHEVVGLDDLSKYGPVARAHDDDPRYRLVVGDARDGELVYRLLDGCDHFVAGAAMVGGIGYYHAFPYDLLAANLRICASSADAAIRRHREGALQKVTYLSSSMVYESASSWPTAEEQALASPPPPSFYGFGALAVDYLARAAWEQHGLAYTVIRPFNCVGVGERRTVAGERLRSGELTLTLNHVVPDLVQKVLRGQDPLRILGSGEQVRCYIHGRDLARGIATAVEHPDARNEAFNLSTAQGTTVLELAAAIWRKVHGPGVPLRVLHDAGFRDDVQRQLASPEKAKRLLGFEATVTLDEMLDEVIPWVEEAIARDLI